MVEGEGVGEDLLGVEVGRPAVGGEDGFIQGAVGVVEPGGTLVVEVGEGEAAGRSVREGEHRFVGLRRLLFGPFLIARALSNKRVGMSLAISCLVGKGWIPFARVSAPNCC